jgi:hypothetical protein
MSLRDTQAFWILGENINIPSIEQLNSKRGVFLVKLPVDTWYLVGEVHIDKCMNTWAVFKRCTEQNLETSTRYRVLFLSRDSFMSKTLEPDGDGSKALAQPASALT